MENLNLMRACWDFMLWRPSAILTNRTLLYFSSIARLFTQNLTRPASKFITITHKNESPNKPMTQLWIQAFLYGSCLVVVLPKS